MAGSERRFTAELWCVPDGTWRFVTLPEELSESIRLASGPPRGFGSVRVMVTVGATTWRTSLFPTAGGGPYLLPVKAATRNAEGVADGDLLTVRLRLLDG